MNYTALLSVIILSALLIPGGLPAEEQAREGVDFGDHRSVTLAVKAWQALERKDYGAVVAYTSKCKELYYEKALEQQGALEAPAPPESAHDHWALNDVGTCLFIRGQAHEAQGSLEAALADYTMITEKLPFSQCWDTKGWFWKPADAARKKFVELKYQMAQKTPEA